MEGRGGECAAAIGGNGRSKGIAVTLTGTDSKTKIYANAKKQTAYEKRKRKHTRGNVSITYH